MTVEAPTPLGRIEKVRQSISAEFCRLSIPQQNSACRFVIHVARYWLKNNIDVELIAEDGSLYFDPDNAREAELFADLVELRKSQVPEATVFRAVQLGQGVGELAEDLGRQDPNFWYKLRDALAR